MAVSPNPASVRAPRGRAWLTVLALLAASAAGGAIAWFHVTRLGPLRTAASGRMTPEQLATFKAGAQLELYLILAVLTTMVLTTILFLRWLVSAVRVAREIDPQRARATPAGAVLWWFVPVFHLFKPYFIVRSTYIASTRSERPAIPLSFGLWWWTWIGANLLAVVPHHITGESPDPQTLLVATRVEFAGDILWAVSALFGIAVILRITGAQRRALRRAT
jgi:hypothetical protein